MEKNVYKKISAVQAEMNKEGISKNRKNTTQGYAFRGIDDVYSAIAPSLARNGLCILPRVLKRDVVERQTKSGGALFYVMLDVEFDMVSADDGSMHTIRVSGEAMDSGDKATNKAMSAAYKYACFITFCIPTEGDNDADAQTHEAKTALLSEAEKEKINSAKTITELKLVYKEITAANPEVKNSALLACEMRKDELAHANTNA